ncbi:MAG: DUF4915 domain-containing protein [Gallionellaceae bacterium]
MPKLLVSLCNLPVASDTAVLQLDVDTLQVSPVNLGATVPIKTCTGLTRDHARLFMLCADTDGKFYLAALRSGDLKPLFFQYLPEIIDGHSILINQGRLYIASTGNDAVISYRLGPTGIDDSDVFWRVAGSRADTHHINGLALWHGDIVLSAFGPKSGQTWSTASNGYLFNLTQNTRLADNLYQPHSIKEWGGNLYYCESVRGNIACLGKAEWEIGGYTRGLDFIAGDTVAVGSSKARKISKSTGLINNPADPGQSSGECEINFFRLSTSGGITRLAGISLSNYAPEFYDVLCLDDVQSTPVTFEEGESEEQIVALAGDEQLQRDLLEQHQALSELSRILEARDQEINLLSERLNWREEEGKLRHAQLQQQAQELILLGQQLEQQAQEVLQLRADLAQETVLSNNLRADLAQQLNLLEEIYGSHSWRFTAPLRWLGRLVRRAH